MGHLAQSMPWVQAVGQSYTAYISVPGTTTKAVLQAAMQAATQNGALNVSTWNGNSLAQSWLCERDL